MYNQTIKLKPTHKPNMPTLDSQIFHLIQAKSQRKFSPTWKIAFSLSVIFNANNNSFLLAAHQHRAHYYDDNPAENYRENSSSLGMPFLWPVPRQCRMKLHFMHLYVGLHTSWVIFIHKYRYVLNYIFANLYCSYTRLARLFHSWSY